MSYKLSDNVLARIVQIVQEGLLLGVDVVDLMRQIEVEVVLTELILNCLLLMQSRLLNTIKSFLRKLKC